MKLVLCFCLSVLLISVNAVPTKRLLTASTKDLGATLVRVPSARFGRDFWNRFRGCGNPGGRPDRRRPPTGGNPEEMPDREPPTDGNPEEMPDREPPTDGNPEEMPDREPPTDGNPDEIPNDPPPTDGNPEEIPNDPPPTDGNPEEIPNDPPPTDGNPEEAPDREPESESPTSDSWPDETELDEPGSSDGAPPPDGEAPSPDGEAPPPNGDAPPPDSETPPTDGDAPPPDSETPPTDGDAPPSAGGPPSGTGSCVSCSVDNYKIVNDYRASNGLNKLGWSEHLADLADQWSKEMYDTAVFKHSDFNYWENIIMGSGMYTWDNVAQGFFDGWKSSAGHDQNMRLPSHKCMGVGVYGDGRKFYGTQIFANECP